MSNFQKYFITFLVTCSIFTLAWYGSTFFGNQKIKNIQDMQNKIAIDILSSETQFALLEDLSCEEVTSTVISDEIAELASKINFAEQENSSSTELELLKKQYTILQVKDFLLNKRIAEKCKKPLATILYFYGTEDLCTDCVKQSYALDAIRQKYPSVRVYAFDYNLDLSTMQALIASYRVPAVLPALVIERKTLSGFQGVEEIEAILPKEIIFPSKEL